MEKQKINEDEEYSYIFCYGSNQIRQLAERIESSFESILSRSFSASLQDYKRIYAGKSAKWGNKSVASVAYSPNFQTDGYTVQMTNQEIQRLDVFEGYPNVYNRQNVDLQIYKDNNFLKVKAQVYVKQKLDQFHEPSSEYIKACCCTLFLHNYLKFSHPKYQILSINITIDIVNGTNMQHHTSYDQIITQKDVILPNLQQQTI